MLLFDDVRKNYFFIQTQMRLWEFSCKNSQQVKQWSTILQYLIDIDKKVFILKSADPSIDDLPTKDILKNHFKSNGNILEIIFIGSDKTYVIIFDNETAVQQLLLQNRTHTITNPLASSSSQQQSQSLNDAVTSPSSQQSNHSDSSAPPLPSSPSAKYQKKVCNYHYFSSFFVLFSANQTNLCKDNYFFFFL